jgi:hypothetical protein
MDSRRHIRWSLVLLAALLHLAVPVGAYAKASPAAGQGDFCTATGAAPPASRDGGSPSPASGEHHCAHAPCCASAAANAAPPPSSPAATGSIAFVHVRVPSGNAVNARVVAIAAAQPRGPPPLV